MNRLALALAMLLPVGAVAEEPQDYIPRSVLHYAGMRLDVHRCQVQHSKPGERNFFARDAFMELSPIIWDDMTNTLTFYLPEARVGRDGEQYWPDREHPARLSTVMSEAMHQSLRAAHGICLNNFRDADWRSWSYERKRAGGYCKP